MSIKHGNSGRRYGAYLICDGCGKTIFFKDDGGNWIDPSFDAAVAFKKDPGNGWKCLKQGKQFIDLCPFCYSAYREKIRDQKLGELVARRVST